MPPGAKHVIPIILDDYWGAKPEIEEGWQSIKLTAIYEVEDSEESKEEGVWTGRIESEQIEVKLNRW